MTSQIIGRSRTRFPSTFDFSSEDFRPQKVSDFTLKKIDEMVGAATVVLFMKGTPTSPGCGFSGTAAKILLQMNIKFNSHDVSVDDNLRQGIKEYSNWPTIPQLYIGGEFIGGSDIITELYMNGELSEMIEVALAS